MKRILLLVAMLMGASAFGANIDTGKSKVEWLGKKVTGQHTGTVTIKSGELMMKEGKLTGGKIVMDMSTIKTTDLSGEWATKLDNHLNSGDFFDTANFKTATLSVTKVKSAGKGKYTITADLMIKKIKKPVTFNVMVEKGMYKGKLVFNRTKYNVKYNSGSFFEGLGDKLINDDVELSFSLALK